MESAQNASKRNKNNEFVFDCSPIEQALESNLRLQESLKKALERIALAKAANRRQVAACLRRLATLERTQHQQPPDDLQEQTQRQQQRHRKWTRRFFVDSKGRSASEPKPNTDTETRREIEARYFFHHLQKPWTKKESNEFMAAVEDSKTSSLGPANVDNTVDFSLVADILKSQRRSGDTSSPCRTPQECHLHHERILREQSFVAFSKSELDQIALFVAIASGAGAFATLDWAAVATQLSSNGTNQRSAWDCLVAYHSKVKTCPQLNTTSPNWTVLEDELLLKLVAAAGPQAVLDSKNALIQFTVLNQLITTKSKKQILARLNQSLLNPNLKRSEWNEEEERRLPIFMKIYYAEGHSNVEPSSFRNDLFLASTHCYGRATKSVVDKWHRTINPEYSSRPFSREEDHALLTFLRTSETHMGWKELSQKHFPDRHPQRLQSRWSELATDHDIVDRERALQEAGPVVRNRKRRSS